MNSISVASISPEISVVIPSFNHRGVIQTIESVLSQDPSNFEIIVVDNSTDPTLWQVLTKSYGINQKVKLIKPEKNLGVTGGRNVGLHHASQESRYILFLDHDILLEAHALSALKKAAESDLRIGIVTGKILFSEDPGQVWSAGTSINLLTGQIHFTGGKDQGQFEETKEVQVAPSIIFTKKKVLEKIGGFDDIFFAVYEDTDFCFRAHDAGFKVIYSPQARAYHKIPLEAEEWKNRLLSRTYYIGRNRIIFMKRHSRYFKWFLLLVPVYFFYYMTFSVRSGRFDGIKNFLKGTLSGLRVAFGNVRVNT
ncbi:MAG: glycosyltransferase family 2 protein [Chlamydiae bacterium]|nr:glycosyltransferase family 2 protein [Chlamydiota bacterium]MBI3277336.1 glycosyltransferase family 2 protein [Chlamydiota bacterium]